MNMKDLCDDLEFAIENLGELETQARSEVALYGDAWPGAALDVDAARRRVEEIKAAIEREEYAESAAQAALEAMALGEYPDY